MTILFDVTADDFEIAEGLVLTRMLKYGRIRGIGTPDQDMVYFFRFFITFDCEIYKVDVREKGINSEEGVNGEFSYWSYSAIADDDEGIPVELDNLLCEEAVKRQFGYLVYRVENKSMHESEAKKIILADEQMNSMMMFSGMPCVSAAFIKGYEYAAKTLLQAI